MTASRLHRHGRVSEQVEKHIAERRRAQTQTGEASHGLRPGDDDASNVSETTQTLRGSEQLSE